MALNEEAFEALVEELQQKSFADARAAYGEKGFQRWRNPKFNGPLDDADTSAGVKGSCGDFIEIFLKFRDKRVEKASYVTNGCGSSALCGSFTAELAHGKDMEGLIGITPSTIIEAIGQLPASDKHCAKLSVMALHKALDEYLTRKVLNKKLYPWKDNTTL